MLGSGTEGPGGLPGSWWGWEGWGAGPRGTDILAIPLPSLK